MVCMTHLFELCYAHNATTIFINFTKHPRNFFHQASTCVLSKYEYTNTENSAGCTQVAPPLRKKLGQFFHLAILFSFPYYGQPGSVRKEAVGTPTAEMQSVVQSSGLFLVTFGHVHCLPRIPTDPEGLKQLSGNAKLDCRCLQSCEFLSSCLNNVSCHQVQ